MKLEECLKHIDLTVSDKEHDLEGVDTVYITCDEDGEFTFWTNLTSKPIEKVIYRDFGVWVPCCSSYEEINIIANKFVDHFPEDWKTAIVEVPASSILV